MIFFLSWEEAGIRRDKAGLEGEKSAAIRVGLSYCHCKRSDPEAAAKEEKRSLQLSSAEPIGCQWKKY